MGEGGFGDASLHTRPAHPPQFLLAQAIPVSATASSIQWRPSILRARRAAAHLT